MLTPIHRALGREPSPVTWELIEDAVREQVQEGADLDWKRALYSRDNPRWQEEAAKDIAAMANSGGGWVVFGIAEDGQTSAAAAITGVTWDQGDQQRLLRVAYNRIEPPVQGLQFTVVPGPSADDSRSVVLMHVPDSAERPHLAGKADAAFVAPVRNGPETAFMSEREIERAFRSRFNLRAEREESIQAMYEDAAERLNPRAGTRFVLTAVPSQPRHLPVRPDMRTLYETFADPDSRGFYTRRRPLDIPWSLAPGRVRRGLRQWTSRTRTDNDESWRAVHEDGTVQAAFRLGGLRAHAEATAPHYPRGEVNHCLSEHVEYALVESVALLRQWATQLAVVGGYRVRAGLFAPPGEPLYVRTPDDFLALMRDVDTAEPIYTFYPVTADVDPLDGMEDLVPVVAEIARDLINQGGVEDLTVIDDSYRSP